MSNNGLARGMPTNSMYNATGGNTDATYGNYIAMVSITNTNVP